VGIDDAEVDRQVPLPHGIDEPLFHELLGRVEPSGRRTMRVLEWTFPECSKVSAETGVRGCGMEKQEVRAGRRRAGMKLRKRRLHQRSQDGDVVGAVVEGWDIPELLSPCLMNSSR